MPRLERKVALRRTQYPVSAFLGNGPLGKLVFELYLKLVAVKAALAGDLGNMVLPVLLIDLVRDFAGHKGLRCKNELQRFDTFERLLQCFESVNRKTGCRDLQL